MLVYILTLAPLPLLPPPREAQTLGMIADPAALTEVKHLEKYQKS